MAQAEFNSCQVAAACDAYLKRLDENIAERQEVFIQARMKVKRWFKGYSTREEAIEYFETGSSFSDFNMAASGWCHYDVKRLRDLALASDKMMLNDHDFRLIKSFM